MIEKPVEVYAGKELAAYGFPDGHPFGLNRHDAFLKQFQADPELNGIPVQDPAYTDVQTLGLFHTKKYIEMVKTKSWSGTGFLDHGDTPAFAGVFEAALCVVGTVIKAIDRIMTNETRKAFVPIAGLHHAHRDSASGFCVFNDIGVAIEYLFKKYNLQKIAYVDIDAHHGDGVYYGFESDPRVIIADIHETGRYLFPGTGFSTESGKGTAEGTKLNIEMQPESGDDEFFSAWSEVMDFLEEHTPDFVIFQCGADSIQLDPLTHLHYSIEAHATAALDLARYANSKCQGKMLAVGGGGYNLSNIGKAWCGVVKSMLQSEME